MKITKTVTGILLAAITFHLISCNSGSNKSITISGAFALYPLGVKWTEQYKKLHPDVRFNVSAIWRKVVVAFSASVRLCCSLKETILLMSRKYKFHDNDKLYFIQSQPSLLKGTWRTLIEQLI